MNEIFNQFLRILAAVLAFWDVEAWLRLVKYYYEPP
jgi:hypothetical protein